MYTVNKYANIYVQKLYIIMSCLRDSDYSGQTRTVKCLDGYYLWERWWRVAWRRWARRRWFVACENIWEGATMPWTEERTHRLGEVKRAAAWEGGGRSCLSAESLRVKQLFGPDRCGGCQCKLWRRVKAIKAQRREDRFRASRSSSWPRPILPSETSALVVFEKWVHILSGFHKTKKSNFSTRRHH